MIEVTITKGDEVSTNYFDNDSNSKIDWQNAVNGIFNGIGSFFQGVGGSVLAGSNNDNAIAAYNAGLQDTQISLSAMKSDREKQQQKTLLVVVLAVLFTVILVAFVTKNKN